MNTEKLTQNAPKMIQTVVFGALLLLLFSVVCRIFAPFFTVFLWSALLYILVSPLFEKITRKMDFSKKTSGLIKKNIVAAIFALGTTVLILLPIIFVVFQLYRQIIELARYARDGLTANPRFFGDLLQKVSDIIRELSAGHIIIDPANILAHVMSLVSSGMQNLIGISSNLARNLGVFVVSFFFLVFCLFFFYLDGPYLARLFLNIIPIRREYTAVITRKFKDIARSLILGYIMVALVQAIFAYIIFSLFQVKGALVFACLTFVCVFIPMVGGSLIWLPLGIARIANGDIVGGIIFLAVSGVVISLLDNILRPIFLQNRIQLHPLIIFFAILGGLRTFGFNGLILGPMIVILFLTVLDLFLTEHQIEHGTDKE
ncbi:MAG: AI-2E family transporter [Spirochaetaceae bacterium]|jgi:predicted PurR-regulated permease PerM|nr:AI-2E family transporter [Spirochaetaceae bacterium]